MTNERVIKKIIRDLQWALRASYNSSSCLNEKQKQFLTELLEEYHIILRTDSPAKHVEAIHEDYATYKIKLKWREEK